MDATELLSRIKSRDTDAYLQLTQDYGWKLYAHLSAKLKDPEQTNRAFNDTLAYFYEMLADQPGDDVIETLLYQIGDYICKQPVDAKQDTVEQTADKKRKKTSRKGGSVAYWIAATVLTILILVALWVIAGLLMDMGYLPKVNLGYDWLLEMLSKLAP